MAVVRGANFQIEGLNDLERQFRRIEKMPKKHLTKAAKLGSNEPLKDARATAPRGKSGLLKKGLHRKMETPNKRTKAVYRIRWNPKYADHYRKPTSGVYGGKTPNAFYPHSIEYGFKTAKGKTEGQYFVTKAVEKNEQDSLNKVVRSLTESIETIIG